LELPEKWQLSFTPFQAASILNTSVIKRIHQHKKKLLHLGLLGAVFAAVIIWLWFGFTRPDEKKQTIAETNSTKKVTRIITRVADTRTDIPYCGGGHKLQKFDLYLPKQNKNKAFPVVIFIHGGGWIRGDKSNGLVDYYGSKLIERGIAVASINYRLAPASIYPAQNQDVACAIKEIASKAKGFHIDPNRIGLQGDSAGGLLAAMYTLTRSSELPPIKAVVEFYGTADLVQQLRAKPGTSFANMYLGGKDETLARAASPMYQPIGGTPPFLLFHGNKDPTVNVAQSKRFYERLHADNPKTQYVEVKGAKHYFTNRNTPNIASIRDKMLAFYTDNLVTNPKSKKP